MAHKPKKLALLHTTHVVIPAFTKLAKEHLEGFDTFHMSDESLIRNTIAAGGLTENTIRRVSALVGLAHEGGADAVLVTCSSIGKATAMAREQHAFPVIRVDEAMADQAVLSAKRIGVAATLITTLQPTLELLRETAERCGRDVELFSALAVGAFEAISAGDAAQHDRLVLATLTELIPKVDVVVLAQASMARVAAMLPAGGPPVLSSPESAMRRARMALEAI
jgi:Asp/Glu/hydantoin racemase